MSRPQVALNAFSLGTFIAGLGVMLGAFGAHALSALPPGNPAWRW